MRKLPNRVNFNKLLHFGGLL